MLERVKTCAIALLFALAVFLGSQTGLFNDFFKSIPVFSTLYGALRDSQAAPAPSPGIISNEAARPSVIVITDERGGHYGAKYDAGALGRAYERTSSVFGEALGSASLPAVIGEDVWRLSLRSPGVYFEYSSPVRLTVLAGWLGVRPAEGLEAYVPRRVCVTFTGGNNTLYFESGGSFYSCDTATPGGGLPGFSENGALFAFETDMGFSFAPYMLISPQTEHPVLQSEVTMTAREMTDAVLSALGVTGQLESSYMRRGDSLRFIGQTFTVTAAPGGRVMMSGTAGGEIGGTDDEGQMIERARVIVAETIGKLSGVASPYFSAVEYDGELCVVIFRYHAEGGLIHLYEDGYAAKITFTGGAVTGAELIFRTVSQTGEMEATIPETQALAAAGAEFILCYPDTGGGDLRPIWVEMEGEA